MELVKLGLPTQHLISLDFPKVIFFKKNHSFQSTYSCTEKWAFFIPYPNAHQSPSLMSPWLKIPLLAIGLLLLLLTSVFFYQTRDRFPGYQINIDHVSSNPSTLQAAFAKRDITPEIPEPWVDADHNFRFDPESGDSYTDLNENGKFDGVWIAGFHNQKPAQGVRDPLWARAMVLHDGSFSLGLVSLDLIGFGSDDVIRIRKRIKKESELDYVIVTSTHTHNGPDVIGLWGKKDFSSGVDPAYMERVYQAAADAVIEAAQSLRPARLRFAQDLSGAANLVMDTRPPYVIDPSLHLMQVLDQEVDTTLGTLVQWSNHPELIWADNLLLSSDYCHDLREGLEKGIYQGDSLAEAGLGGISLFVNGSIGGLMTTDPKTGIPDPFSDTMYVAPSFDKVKAAGEGLALLGLNALRASGDEIETGAIKLQAQSIQLPMDNKLYRLAGFLGLLKRGYEGWFSLRSELAVWSIGPALFVHQPGEIYPEIMEGGIESPAGQDFAIEPLEVPPLRSLMHHKYQFVVGLSNDMIGYIVPRSQWDALAPFTYQQKDAPYGEINSLGPQTAPIIHGHLKEMLESFRP